MVQLLLLQSFLAVYSTSTSFRGVLFSKKSKKLWILALKPVCGLFLFDISVSISTSVSSLPGAVYSSNVTFVFCFFILHSVLISSTWSQSEFIIRCIPLSVGCFNIKAAENYACARITFIFRQPSSRTTLKRLALKSHNTSALLIS